MANAGDTGIATEEVSEVTHKKPYVEAHHTNIRARLYDDGTTILHKEGMHHVALILPIDTLLYLLQELQEARDGTLPVKTDLSSWRGIEGRS